MTLVKRRPVIRPPHSLQITTIKRRATPFIPVPMTVGIRIEGRPAMAGSIDLGLRADGGSALKEKATTVAEGGVASPTSPRWLGTSN